MRWPLMLKSTHDEVLGREIAFRQTIVNEMGRVDEKLGETRGKLFGFRDHVETIATDLAACRCSRDTAADRLRAAVVTVFGKPSGPMGQ